MEDLPKNTPFIIAINLMKFIGETKHNASTKLILFRVLNCSIMLLILLFTSLNVFYGKGVVRIKTLQGITTISHALLKYLLFIYYKPDVEKLLMTSTQNSINLNKSSNNAKMKRIIKAAKFTQMSLIIFILIILYLYLTRPIFNTEYSFLLETFIPNSVVMDAVVLAAQYYFSCLALSVVMGYDLIYFVLCLQVVLSVKLLKQRIEEKISHYIKNDKEHVKNFVDHHRKLLLIHSRMRVVYSIMLIFHYFVTITTACSDIFVLIGHENTTNVLIELISIFVIFGQFACYSFPAEEIVNEFADISNVFYMTKWYHCNVKVQKMILFVMMKSQCVQYFSGAGLININVNAFGSVVRKSFSFYAVIKNLLRK